MARNSTTRRTALPSVGYVLDWLGCIAAAAVVLAVAGLSVSMVISLQTPLDSGFLPLWSSAAAVAVAAWLIGRASRYVLAGT